MPLVYVLNKDGEPLMPCKPARVKHLLRDGEATVEKMEPFTIRLSQQIPAEIQPVTVGVDLGASKVGLAATAGDNVLYQAELALRTDIHKRMETRANYRRTRRSRKLRYRSPRFNNRRASRRKGRLPPSIQSRVDSVLKAVRRMAGFLPVSEIVVEVAQFDIHKLKKGRALRSWEYQRGELYGYENIKMYVRQRDDYTCQYCKKKNPTRLEVDHIIPRSRGGTTVPENLVASCHDCNQAKGKMTAREFGHPKVRLQAQKSYRAMAITQQGKTATLEGLRAIAPVSETYGYITKCNRQKMGLPKTHYYDAVAIASRGNLVESLDCYEALRAVSKGARKQRRGAHSQLVARLPYEVFGYRMWDKVSLPDGMVGFVGARRSRGSFLIRDVYNESIREITHRKLRLLQRTRTLVAATVPADGV